MAASEEVVLTTPPQAQFFRLARRGLTGEIRELMAENPGQVDVNAFDQTGYTAMHMASQEGFAELIRFLHASGATQQAAVSGSGDYPLHLAAWKNRIKAIRALLELGASPIVTNNDGRFPSSYAKDDSEAAEALAAAIHLYADVNPEEMADSNANISAVAGDDDDDVGADDEEERVAP